MMKVENLMIGDWVKVNDIEHTHPLQVAEIFKKSGAYYATLYWDGMPDNVNPETLTADVDKVLPISLTPEILKKNGFEEYNGLYRLDIVEGVFINVDFKSKEPFVSIHNTCYRAIPICKYVHQLQHALRLCGIEKDIKL